MVGTPPHVDAQQGRAYVRKLLAPVRKIRKESLVYEHTRDVPDVDPPTSSVDIEPATEPLLDRLDISADRRAKFVRFLRAGHRGLFAHDGETLVARGWICTPESTSAPYTLPEHVTDLDAYWLFHARTSDTYRNRGWHTYLVRRRLAWIYDRDPDAAVLTDTEPGNVSRYTFRSTGFVPRGTMTTYRIGHPSIAVKQFGRWEPGADHPPLPERPST